MIDRISFNIENINIQIHSLIITYKATTILLYQLYNPDRIERMRGIRDLGIFVRPRAKVGGKMLGLLLSFELSIQNVVGE